MPGLDETSVTELQQLLEDVESKSAAQQLMAAIASKQGLTADEIVRWFGFDRDDVDEWFAEFRSKPVEEVIDEVERFELPGRRAKPFVRVPNLARVSFLNYEVIEDNGWDVDDENLFAKASKADLDAEDYGRIAVEEGESILEAAEDRGFDWPYACRGGACSNCAVLVKNGEIAMPGQQILPESALERGARLTCVGVPATEQVDIIYNAKSIDFLDELRLPAAQFEG